MIAQSWISRLSDRDRRTLGVGTAVIATVLLLAKGGPAWRSWERDAVAGATELITDARHSDAVIAAYPAIRDSLHARATRLRSADSSIVAGDDPSSAAASLAGMVADAALDAGVKLGAVQPRVDSEPHSLGAKSNRPHPDFARVSAKGDATGDIVALTQFLADMEHGPVLLAVREIYIAQPEPAAPSDRMETLHADFTVVGLARAPVEAKSAHDRRKDLSSPAMPSPGHPE